MMDALPLAWATGTVRFALTHPSGSSSVWRVTGGKDESLWIESAAASWSKTSIHVASRVCFSGRKSERTPKVFPERLARSFDRWKLLPCEPDGWYHAMDVLLSEKEVLPGSLQRPSKWPRKGQFVIALDSPGPENCLVVRVVVSLITAAPKTFEFSFPIAKLRLSQRYWVFIIAETRPRPHLLYNRLRAGARQFALETASSMPAHILTPEIDKDTGFRSYVELRVE